MGSSRIAPSRWAFAHLPRTNWKASGSDAVSGLAGQAAAITGAGGGIARAIASTLAAEGASIGALDINALAPGPVPTPGADTVITPEGWGARRARTPLKRLASAEDMGAAAVFLASAAASRASR